MGAEGAGGRESYPTNDIPNKHIYDAFLTPSGLQKRSQMAIIDYVQNQTAGKVSLKFTCRINLRK